MTTVSMALPILPGKTESMKQLARDVSGPRRPEFAETLKRMKVTRHLVWLQQTPHGDMAIMYMEVEDFNRAMQLIASSNNPFERWYRERLTEIHGIDLSQPIPPTQLVLEWQASK